MVIKIDKPQRDLKGDFDAGFVCEKDFIKYYKYVYTEDIVDKPFGLYGIDFASKDLKAFYELKLCRRRVFSIRESQLQKYNTFCKEHDEPVYLVVKVAIWNGDRRRNGWWIKDMREVLNSIDYFKRDESGWIVVKGKGFRRL